MYLNDDLSYRADRVDRHLTLLWHPYKEDLIGIKLKGFKLMFETIKKLANLGDEHFLPLVKCLELAMFAGGAEAMMAHHEVEGKERIKKKYKQALIFVEQVNVPAEELRKLAA